MRRTALRTVTALAAAASMVACGDSGSPSADAQMNFNLATKQGPAGVSASSTALASTPETYTDGTNTLVIERVQLVLREIELNRVENIATCGETVADHSCEELELDPVLLDLPLGGAGGAARTFSVAVAPGSYDEVEFEIHKPSGDDGSDAAFLQAHPDFAGVSVKVTGSYNGHSFAYTTDLDAEQEIELSPPLVAAESGSTDLTLFVDLDRWFRDGSGALLDPESANPGHPNESLVEDTIKATLRAFEDEDHDGADDHGSDDGGSVG
jgi:hypothetical protein